MIDRDLIEHEEEAVQRRRALAYEDEPDPCPMCTGPTYVLGDLGTATAFRCRDCGVTGIRTRPLVLS